jgi:hypothetical protein
MILATTPTLSFPWILGSLRSDWNPVPNPAEEALWQGRNPKRKTRTLEGTEKVVACLYFFVESKLIEST